MSSFGRSASSSCATLSSLQSIEVLICALAAVASRLRGSRWTDEEEIRANKEAMETLFFSCYFEKQTKMSLIFDHNFVYCEVKTNDLPQ